MNYVCVAFIQIALQRASHTHTDGMQGAGVSIKSY